VGSEFWEDDFDDKLVAAILGRSTPGMPSKREVWDSRRGGKSLKVVPMLKRAIHAQAGQYGCMVIFNTRVLEHALKIRFTR